jgi:hypothetical protein
MGTLTGALSYMDPPAASRGSRIKHGSEQMQSYIRIWTPPGLQAEHGRGKMDSSVRIFDLSWGATPGPDVIRSLAPHRPRGIWVPRIEPGLARDGLTNLSSATCRACEGMDVCSYTKVVLLLSQNITCIDRLAGKGLPRMPVHHRDVILPEAPWVGRTPGARERSPILRSAHAIRAILFATATQALCIPTRATSC